MTIQEFETKIKELDANFSIKDFGNDPNRSDINAIIWTSPEGHKIDICTIPSREIFEETNQQYRDSNGTIHRSVPEAIGQCNLFLKKWEENAYDPSIDCTFRQLMTELL